MELADVEEKHAIIRENRNYLKIIMGTLLPKIPKIFLFSNKMILKYILLILLEKILNLAEKNEFLELVESERYFTFLIYKFYIFKERKVKTC